MAARRYSPHPPNPSPAARKQRSESLSVAGRETFAQVNRVTGEKCSPVGWDSGKSPWREAEGLMLGHPKMRHLFFSPSLTLGSRKGQKPWLTHLRRRDEGTTWGRRSQTSSFPRQAASRLSQLWTQKGCECEHKSGHLFVWTQRYELPNQDCFDYSWPFNDTGLNLWVHLYRNFLQYSKYICLMIFLITFFL